MALNPNAGEFIPGQWSLYFGSAATSAAANPVATQSSDASQMSWEEQATYEESAAKQQAKPKETATKPKETKPKENKPKDTAPAQNKTAESKPTESKFVIEDDDEGEEKVKEVELKLKKLDWGSSQNADPREHINIVFIGHVDAGKSTCSGQIMFLMGMVDERTIAKYKQESANLNRSSWFLAYIMDTIEEERAKGKTVEVGRAHFETEKKRYTILDAPGHKNYVPNMIMGVSQADVGVLIISARKGEFEAGFDRSGQTREHAILAKTLGVRRIIIAVNKMDDYEPAWSKERYDMIVDKISTFLKSLGFPKSDIYAVPISGLSGANIKDKVDPSVCPWYSGESLIGILDTMPPIPRQKDAPLRMPILDKYKDMGALNLTGKIESGRLRVGQQAMLVPGNIKVDVVGIANDMAELGVAEPGENIRVVVRGVEEDVCIAFPSSITNYLQLLPCIN